MSRLALLPVRELNRDWTNLAYEIVNSKEFSNPVTESLKKIFLENI